MPGRHPDDDLLADLAADVLPADQARAVEAHVMSCHRCTGLLEDAERVRSLLLAGDPGPVPADVWRRVEAALAAEGANATSSSAGPDHARDTAAFQAFVDAGPPDHARPRDDAFDHARASDDAFDHARPPDDALDDADPLDDPARWERRPIRRGIESGSRRDARAGSVRRRGPLLLAAAAVLAIVAVTGSVKLLGRNSSSGASLSAGTAESSQSAPAGAASPSRAPMVRSGRDYHASKLAAEASGLLAVTTGAASTAPTPGHSKGRTGTGDSASSGAASPQAVAPRVSKVPAAPVPANSSATDITNPARLAACLSALDVTPDRLVAVDLATYEGREAAILLLRTADGSGYEVWAVERTCAPQAEGALKYARLSD
jgi:hypothetical protein